jgi:hypothetical protein
MTHRMRTIGTLSIAVVVAIGCSAEKSSTPPPTFRSPLVYESTKHMRGLDEDIVIHKGPDGVWCRRANDAIEDCESVRTADRATYFSHYGVMSKALADSIANRPDDEMVVVSVLFDVLPPDDLNSPDSVLRASQRRAFSADIIAGGSRLQSWIEQRGGRVVEATNDTMPFFVMEAAVSVVRAIARLPSVTRVMDTDHGGNVSIPADPGRTDSVLFSAVDTVYNSTGNYGQNFTVGILGAGNVTVRAWT